MKVLFRADASLAIGSGHIMRCLTLASELDTKGIHVEFACAQKPGHLIELIKSKGFVCHSLPFDENSSDNFAVSDADYTIGLLQLSKYDLVVVDHYELNDYWLKQVNQYTHKTLVIDDLANRFLSCDYLLNQNYGVTEEDYFNLVAPHTKLLLGVEYSLLRNEFSEFRQQSLARNRQSEHKTLLINMGGIDNDNITLQCLDSVDDIAHKDNYSLKVIMGKNAPHVESIKERLQTLPIKSELIIDCQNIAYQMTHADIAIGAAGSTTWERFCLGLPSILVPIADNQRVFINALAADNLAIKVEMPEISNLAKIINDTNLDNTITMLSDNTRALIDGSGAQKVADIIMGDY
ncbi:UDP-2,4-diacetamido-2,4,6-trideoxy-beta-L-altropyranose hydrolase [Bermanella sp. R86510]|uniref:UDP-2,4-diacetamido-2,4, 6-trideoxy-beta-L-altropyranose hydrolase n=1 Tax=unclassified Bermanella TaxID=2627862 RepID=UPI0037C9ACDC